MTRQKQLKRLIRERMAKTGESYTSARRHIVNSTPSREYVLAGGVHPDTSCVASVLRNRAVVSPFTDEPLSEAMVLGVGGGLGAGYILWEFKEHGKHLAEERIITLGFRKDWQYPARWIRTTCDRLGMAVEVHETAGAGKAAAALEGALARGVPGIAWVDIQIMGYRNLPARREGHFGYPIVIYGVEGDRVLIDDRNTAPLSAPAETVAAARSRIVSYKNRLVEMDAAVTELDADRLRAGITAGLRDCAEHLGGRSDSFSLPAFRKWAQMLGPSRNAKAWRTVFADRKGLFGALLSVYEDVERAGADGGNLRALYADFLDEAAPIVSLPALGEVAGAYRDLAARWSDLAGAALTEEVPDLRRAAEIMRRIDDLVTRRGDSGRREAAAAASDLWALWDSHEGDLALDEEAMDSLFDELRTRLLDIFEAETAANRMLAEAAAM